MGYCGFMGYGIKIPAHRVGGFKILWGIRGYGLSGLWVKRGSTVLNASPLDQSRYTRHHFLHIGTEFHAITHNHPPFNPKYPALTDFVAFYPFFVRVDLVFHDRTLNIISGSKTFSIDRKRF